MFILRIAICDDDKNICCDLENKINRIAAENDYNDIYTFDIKIFYSVDDLYKYFLGNEDALDVIFLDIKFYENNTAGVIMGNTIRKYFLDETVKIIYISNVKDYAMDLFDAHPFNFFLKPISYVQLNDSINSIMKIMNRQNKPFIYVNKGVKKKIDLFKILYFFNHGRKIEIITINSRENLENDVFYGKISDIGKQLSKSDFFFVHQSYLVNYHNVANFEYKKLTLVNGTELPISQRYRKYIREMRANKLAEK